MKYLIIFFALIFFNYSYSQKTSSDDGLHFGAGVVMSGLTYTLVYNKTKNKKKAFWYSFGITTLAGLAKEFYDGNIISGRFDNSEFLATAAGGLSASITLNVFTGKSKKNKEEEILAELNLSTSQQYPLRVELP